MPKVTNQKLGRAKLLLSVLQEVDEPRLIAALAEATLLEMGLAYRCFLQEIAREHCSTPLATEPDSAAALAASLRLHDTTVAEIDALAALEKDGGWPQKLLTVARPSAEAALPQPAVEMKPNRINAIQIEGNQSIELTYSSCLSLYETLYSNIEQQRAMAQEW